MGLRSASFMVVCPMNFLFLIEITNNLGKDPMLQMMAICKQLSLAFGKPAELLKGWPYFIYFLQLKRLFCSNQAIG